MNRKDGPSENKRSRERAEEEGTWELRGQRQALDIMRAASVLDNVLLHREARRLSRKLGEAHPRVQRLRTAIEGTRSRVHDLQVQLEIAEIEVPETPEDGTVVHGRVMDEHGNGWMGLTVYGEDEKCKEVCQFGSANTDHSGYYAIALDAELLNMLAEINVFLAVKTKAGSVLSRRKKALVLEPSSRQVVEILVERAKLAKQRGKQGKKGSQAKQTAK